MNDKEIYQEGIQKVSLSKIIICGIVRDCAKNLKRNISTINKFCHLAADYKVIIFENDSKDDTKKVLNQWSKTEPNIIITTNNYNTTRTIPKENSKISYNPYYSKSRIEKMSFYRNQYLDYIEKYKLSADFIIVVDLDVAKINFTGIINSFGQEREWDSISANGFSLSPKLFKRYHDAYALVEDGMEKKPQTEHTIQKNQNRFSFLKKGIPLIRVYSAFGGLAIYKFEAIKNCRYNVLLNHNQRVEVRCEHFGLHKQIHDKGYNKFYINPGMLIKYQKLTFKLIFKTIKHKLMLK